MKKPLWVYGGEPLYCLALTVSRGLSVLGDQFSLLSIFNPVATQSVPFQMRDGPRGHGQALITAVPSSSTGSEPRKPIIIFIQDDGMEAIP